MTRTPAKKSFLAVYTFHAGYKVNKRLGICVTQLESLCLITMLE